MDTEKNDEVTPQPPVAPAEAPVAPAGPETVSDPAAAPAPLDAPVAPEQPEEAPQPPAEGEAPVPSSPEAPVQQP
ncbi:MAG TPA: hypothetical protein VMT30_01310 [Candidatus Saccharimonadia bacterium]|nr:hypothetical protein [Candidatus Saccharimonadia bacterium]